MWLSRYLALIGKIVIIKAARMYLHLSQLTIVISSPPNPTQDMTSITPFGATNGASETVSLARAKLRRGTSNQLVHGTLLTDR